MKNIVEQAERSVSKIGKFNTADDLLTAYNALECEFTKRCQLVKELQAELAALRAQTESIPPVPPEVVSVSAPPPEPESEPEPAADAATPAEEQAACVSESARNDVAEGQIPCGNESERARVTAGAQPITEREVLDIVTAFAAEYAEVLAQIPEIQSACIARYKQRLLDGRNIPAPCGAAVITPSKRPKTLSDAKRLADELLGGA